MQPFVHVGELDCDHAALVLLVGRQLWVWLVHSAHDGMCVGVLGQHGVALDDFAGFLAGPGAPQAGKAPGLAVGPPETPPDIASAFPARLVERPGRDDAPLATQPWLLVGRLAGDFLEAGIVGRVGQLCRPGEPRNQAPLSNDQFVFAFRADANEWPRRPREHRLFPPARLVALADMPEALDFGFLWRDVASAHTVSLDRPPLQWSRRLALPSAMGTQPPFLNHASVGQAFYAPEDQFLFRQAGQYRIPQLADH